MTTNMRSNLALLTLVAGVFFAAITSSNAAVYAISWTGSADFTLSGTFSFDDSLLNTGAIDETQIQSLEFEVFENGISVGAIDLPNFDLTNADDFNFNFDTTSEQFLVGGSGAGTSGQAWNTYGTPVGFTSGLGLQGLTIEAQNPSIIFGGIATASSTLTATAIPEPSTAFLLGSGALALALSRRRQAK